MTMTCTSTVNTFSDASPIFVLICIFIITFLIKKPTNNKLNLPPGPRGLPLVGNLLSLDPDLPAHFTSLAQTYGPIYTLKLGKKTGVVITSPSIAKQVLKDHDTTFANRDVPLAAKEATYGGADVVWTPYGPEWRMLRKVCVREMLGVNTLDSVYALRHKEIRGTIKYIYSRAGSAVNVGERMFVMALNVVTSMMWGRAGIGGEFKEVVGEMTELLGAPNMSDFYPVGWLERLDVQGIGKRMRGLAKRLDEVFERVIDERLNKIRNGNGQQERDFLGILLEMMMMMNDNNDGAHDHAKTPRFTITHLKALFMDMVVGGTDTTSNLVEYALAEMMNKPEILTKAQQELETVVGKDNMVEESHINKLPYLHLVMKEILRLHPPLPLLVPHCPSATCHVAGYTIPKGARVFVNVWAIHRDPSIWENPLEFRPERFLDGKWDYSGNDFSYFPFGSGRRMCAGTAMAERMFMFSLASLVHSFDWSLPAGEKMDLSEKSGGIVMKKKVPLIAIPNPRLSNPDLYE